MYCPELSGRNYFKKVKSNEVPPGLQLLVTPRECPPSPHFPTDSGGDSGGCPAPREGPGSESWGQGASRESQARPGTAPHQPLAHPRAAAPSVTACPQAARTSIPRKDEDLGFLPGPPGESRQPGAPAGTAAWHSGLRRRSALLPEPGAAKMGAHSPPRDGHSQGKAQASGALKQMRCQEVPRSQAWSRRGPRGVGYRGRKHGLSPASGLDAGLGPRSSARGQRWSRRLRRARLALSGSRQGRPRAAPSWTARSRALRWQTGACTHRPGSRPRPGQVANSLSPFVLHSSGAPRRPDHGWVPSAWDGRQGRAGGAAGQGWEGTH